VLRNSPIQHRQCQCALANPGLLHKLVDPDAGDTLLVVIAPPPTRGFIKRQDSSSCRCWNPSWRRHPSDSDDVTAEVGSDKVMLAARRLTLYRPTSPPTRHRAVATAVRSR